MWRQCDVAFLSTFILLLFLPLIFFFTLFYILPSHVPHQYFCSVITTWGSLCKPVTTRRGSLCKPVTTRLESLCKPVMTTRGSLCKPVTTQGSLCKPVTTRRGSLCKPVTTRRGSLCKDPSRQDGDPNAAGRKRSWVHLKADVWLKGKEMKYSIQGSRLTGFTANKPQYLSSWTHRRDPKNGGLALGLHVTTV